ncbi:PREDICTED: kielin/chordin-like protein [Acropora digitifera]|uniref:kielin/chordin-like protein n=1 Tax=Acropora digitifera TaxID=70779 RepID=UPI00077AD355|nr:PREDICTED: kielin/chordin-like protein [Acropora digitifera]
MPGRKSYPQLPHCSAPNCTDSQGNTRQIGETWKEGILSTCSCTGPMKMQCSSAVRPPPTIFSCTDNQRNTREPGDVWLKDPKTNCTCTSNNSVACEQLSQPVCLDVSGQFRKNFETWLNGSCVECACVNGSINCTEYDVIITPGLYKVDVSPTCQLCDIRLQTALSSNACIAFRDQRAKLTECASGGFYIQGTHLCNGMEECPDGSDEKNCENVVCKDEEGKVLVMKSTGGWIVSKCLRCLCIEGLVTCNRTLTVFFPAYFGAVYEHEETCKQPSCKILDFVRNNKKRCEGAELIKDRGIIYEGQTWKANGCDFYFNGSLNYQECPLMTRPVCYVFNGFVCCASQCPALQQIAGQMRGNLSFCANGRQVASNNSDCKDTSNCLQNINIQNCFSEVTCQDEDGNQYFEGATWSVGSCMQCACVSGIIQCSRVVSLVSFLKLNQPIGAVTFTESCNQSECNVAKYMEKNAGVCHACRWNDKLYYDGDHWKENYVDFFCTKTSHESPRVRPGCYVESRRVKCTGAIAGIRQLTLISNHQLFLCDSGDEIRPIRDRCDIGADCEDFSDERNCENYYCSYETAHGFLWNKTRLGQQVLRECSLVNPTWTGLFGSKCGQNVARTVWDHKHICNCENRALLEYFKKNNAKVNSTNFFNVSEDLAISGKAKEFPNPRIFLRLNEELFLNITSRFLTPLTLDNANLALQYCLSFIDTMRNSPQYSVKDTFCKAELAEERDSLIEKALEFLRQAPGQTEAHRVGWGPNNLPALVLDRAYG